LKGGIIQEREAGLGEKETGNGKVRIKRKREN